MIDFLNYFQSTLRLRTHNFNAGKLIDRKFGALNMVSNKLNINHEHMISYVD